MKQQARAVADEDIDATQAGSGVVRLNSWLGPIVVGVPSRSGVDISCAEEGGRLSSEMLYAYNRPKKGRPQRTFHSRSGIRIVANFFVAKQS